MRTVLARVLIQVPEPNDHPVYFHGACANRVQQDHRSEGQAPSESATDRPRKGLHAGPAGRRSYVVAAAARARTTPEALAMSL